MHGGESEFTLACDSPARIKPLVVRSISLKRSPGGKVTDGN